MNTVFAQAVRNAFIPQEAFQGTSIIANPSCTVLRIWNANVRDWRLRAHLCALILYYLLVCSASPWFVAVWSGASSNLQLLCVKAMRVAPMQSCHSVIAFLLPIRPIYILLTLHLYDNWPWAPTLCKRWGQTVVAENIKARANQSTTFDTGSKNLIPQTQKKIDNTANWSYGMKRVKLTVI